MANKKRMKLCSGCDGFIDLDVIVCPYCGCDVQNSAYFEDSNNSHSFQEKDDTDALSSLYPPPYNPMNVDIPDPSDEAEEISHNKAQVKEKALEVNDETASRKTFFISTLMFSVGVNIFFMGLFLLFFSKNGELFLRWNASLWYLYVLIALPILFISYKMFSKISNDQ